MIDNLFFSNLALLLLSFFFGMIVDLMPNIFRKTRATIHTFVGFHIILSLCSIPIYLLYVIWN